MKLKLIKLTKKYELKLGEMIDEWKIDQEMNNTKIGRASCRERVSVLV